MIESKKEIHLHLFFHFVLLFLYVFPTVSGSLFSQSDKIEWISTSFFIVYVLIFPQSYVCL